MALSPITGSYGNVSSVGPFGANTGTTVPGLGFDAKNATDVMTLAGRAMQMCQTLPPQFASVVDSYMRGFQALSSPDAVDIQAASVKLNNVLQILARANAQTALSRVENLLVDPTQYLEDGQQDPYSEIGSGYSTVPDPSQIQVDSGVDTGVQTAYQAILGQLGNLGADSLTTTSTQLSVEASLSSMISQSLFGS